MSQHPKNKKHRFIIGKRKALKRAKGCVIDNITDEELLFRSQNLRNSTKTCSCVMCGNPRRYFTDKGQYTIQELKEFSKEGL